MAENCEGSDVYATMFNKLACHSFMNANQTLDSFIAVSQYGTSPQKSSSQRCKEGQVTLIHDRVLSVRESDLLQWTASLFYLCSRG